MPDLTQIKVIVFDLDMTLVPSQEAAELALIDMEKNHGISRGDVDWADLWGGTPDTAAQMLKAANSTPLTWQEIRDLDQQYMENHYRDLKMPDVETLRNLRRAGILLAIVSNAARRKVEMVLGNSDAEDLFEPVLCLEDPGTKAERILACLESLGMKQEEAAYVGDHPTDIAAARKAGVTAVAVSTGFYDQAQLVEYQPDRVIASLDELLLPGV